MLFQHVMLKHAWEDLDIYEAMYTSYIILFVYIAPGDYTGLTFNTTGTMNLLVAIVDDNIYEGDTEFFTVSLAPVIQDPRITLNISMATIFIEDNGELNTIVISIAHKRNRAFCTGVGSLPLTSCSHTQMHGRTTVILV